MFMLIKHNHLKIFPVPMFLIIAILIFSSNGCRLGQIPGSTAAPTPTPKPGITVCTTGCDFSTLQAAIDAVTTGAGDIIGLNDPVHTEAGIRITKSIIIQGRGVQETIVQADPNPEAALERVFFVASGVTVTIRTMTIRHGNPESEPESGGGIRNEGTLTLERVAVSDNSGSAGGGILNDGTLTLIDSTISGNTARGGGDAQLECDTGGGMKIMTGKVTLINSTISNNKAKGKGGGVHVACNGVLVLVNSTISGNYTNNYGGGIFLNGVGEFTHSTINGNNANTGGGVVFSGSGEKGLIRGQLNYANTIIANNTARLEKYGVADCLLGDYGTIAVNSNNWVGDGNCNATFSGDPLLGSLADNGGNTQTHALLPGSLAIDVLQPEYCILLTDQRGLPRVAPCDIGAYEVQR
jgi:hypothetical protein